MLKKIGASAAISLVSLPVVALDDIKELDVVEVIGKEEANGLELDAHNSASNRLGLTSLETPASMEVISQDRITLKGDHSSLSALTRAAGFASSASPGNGGTSVSVRGFNGHGSIVHTYDGTRLYVGAGTVTFPADTGTVESIEVLRGPGSVINGVGAIGATVNYMPKAPQFTDIENSLGVTLGSFGLQRFAVDSGGAINSMLAYHLSAINHSSDGYVDNADESRNVIAGALRYKPSDYVDVKFSVDYADIDDDAYWGTPLVDGQIPESIRRNNYNVSDGIVIYEDLWPRVEVNWKINDSLTFKNNTYYLDAQRHWKNVEGYTYQDDTADIERSFYLEILHDQTQIGTRNDLLFEVNIGAMKNTLNVGFELNDIEFTHTNNSPYGGITNVSLTNPVQGIWAGGVRNTTSKDYSTDTFQYALFLDNNLKINDQYSVVTGLRYDNIDYSREDFARDNGNGATPQPAGNIDFDLSGVSWRTGLVYQPNTMTSLYVQTSKAVDALQSIVTATNPNNKLSEGRQFELGIKQHMLDNKLQLTVALFDIVKKNIVSKEIGGIDRQVGEQASQGVELNLFAKPSDTFNIEFNAAYVEPEFKEFDEFTGNNPRNVAEKTANLWASWAFLNDWIVSGGVRYVGERFANNSNTTTLPDYAVYDASVNWDVNNALQLALRGKNLTDEIDYVLAPYGSQWILAEGRSVELGLNYSF